MVCPLCNTEAKINKATNVFKNGKLFRKQTFVCRNKSCKNYEKELDSLLTELPFVEESDDKALE